MLGPSGRSLLVVSTAAVVVIGAVACGGGGSPDASPTPSASPSVASSPDATAAATATPSPTPLGTPFAEAYELEPALPAADFERMVAFVLVPGAEDEAAVVTQGGEVWRVPLDGGEPALFADLSGRVIDFHAENEGGLLGLAFSPDYETDGRVYLYFTSNECRGGSPRCDVLARYLVAGDVLDPATEKVFVEVPDPFENHNGGQIAFGPDGNLYVGIGDGGSAGDPQGNGQDLSTLLGAILRLDVSSAAAAAPPDNPFVGTPEARAVIYAYGLRNPWRFSFDRATGALWVGDVGQNAWEEVDRILPGGNYGWNVREGFECFEPPSGCASEGLTPPRAAYGHDLGCSVTGGYVYRGTSMPELFGWYLYGDFCSGRIWAVNTVDDSDPVLLADTGKPIASFGELPDGELLALTFEGVIFRLVRES